MQVELINLMRLGLRRVVDYSCHYISLINVKADIENEYTPIFLVLIGAHLKRLMYTLMAVREARMITALSPSFFLSSCSGSAVHARKVTTSFAIWLVVAGVPSPQKLMIQVAHG